MPNAGYTFRDVVPGPAAGETVEAFYGRRWPHFTVAQWRARVEAGQVTSGGRVLRPGETVAAGQVLDYRRPPWDEPDVPTDFRVLHLDDHLAALAKPAGLPVLPGAGCQDRTLLALARAAIDPGLVPVHRIDRGTSGVVMFARTRAAAAAIGRATAWRHVGKDYLARVRAAGLPDRFTVDRPIGLVPYPPLGRVHGVAPDGRPAVTICEVLRRDGDEAVLGVRLVTGRSHQIRIHLAWAGWPLVGEPLFGPGGQPRPADPGGRPVTTGDIGYRLHAWRLRLPHPATGELLEVVAEPPEDLAPSATAQPERR